MGEDQIFTRLNVIQNQHRSSIPQTYCPENGIFQWFDRIYEWKQIHSIQFHQ